MCLGQIFKELSSILTARGASYRIKGKIYKACVQRALTHGTDLHPEWAVFRDMWRGFISGGTSNPS